MKYSLDDTAFYYHKLTEIFKHSYSRRSVVSDEKFEPDVTKELLFNFTNFDPNDTNSYFNTVLREIKESNQTKEPSFYGGLDYFISDNGTAHMSIIDQFGNAISVTSTINMYFGSGILSDTGKLSRQFYQF